MKKKTKPKTSWKESIIFSKILLQSDQFYSKAHLACSYFKWSLCTYCWEVGERTNLPPLQPLHVGCRRDTTFCQLEQSAWCMVLIKNIFLSFPVWTISLNKPAEVASFSLQAGKTPILWDFWQIYILQVKSSYGPQKSICCENPVAAPVPGRAGTALCSPSWEHPLEEFLHWLHRGVQ